MSDKSPHQVAMDIFEIMLKNPEIEWMEFEMIMYKGKLNVRVRRTE